MGWDGDFLAGNCVKRNKYFAMRFLFHLPGSDVSKMSVRLKFNMEISEVGEYLVESRIYCLQNPTSQKLTKVVCYLFEIVNTALGIAYLSFVQCACAS